MKKKTRDAVNWMRVVLFLLPFFCLEACTGIKLVAKDGSVIHGRTEEFGLTLPTNIVVIPRNYSFKGTTPNGPGMIVKGKYAFVGASAFDDQSVLDGMNEKGLSVGAFYFPTFASYAEITPTNQAMALSPIEFPNWILTQFSSVEELIAAIPSVVIAPTVSNGWGSSPPPFHYVVYDKSGKSIAIEPIDGKLVIHDNPFGIFTNSPNFDWHMTNLRNYINLHIDEVKPVTLQGIPLLPLGQGAGLLGLPGDFTPPSRFVRATLYAVSAIPSETGEQAIFQAFHILNQFDIPIGIDRKMVGNVIQSDFTQATCVRDPQSLKFYYKTYDDQTIRFVDLNKFDLNSKQIKKITTTGFQKAVDMSPVLK